MAPIWFAELTTPAAAPPKSAGAPPTAMICDGTITAINATPKFTNVGTRYL
jgi:hypothetical protein